MRFFPTVTKHPNRTWTAASGEEWSPAQGLESVLLSIQSLLSANPYINEPGFENATNPEDKEKTEVYKAKVGPLQRVACIAI